MQSALFGDTEDILINHLASNLRAIRGADVPVGTRIPNPRPPEFVRILLAGGQMRNQVTAAPSVTVEGWADGEYEAIRLVQTCLATFQAVENTVLGAVHIGTVDVIGLPVNLPDPDSAQARYTFTISVELSYQSILTF